MATEQTPKNEELETNIAFDREDIERKIAFDCEEFEVIENESSNSDSTLADSNKHYSSYFNSGKFKFVTSKLKKMFASQVEQISDSEEFEVIENENSNSYSTSAVSSETMTTENTFGKHAFQWIFIDFLLKPRDFVVGSPVVSKSKVRTQIVFWLMYLLVLSHVIPLLDEKEIACASIETNPIKAQFNQLVLISYAETVGEIPLAIVVRNYTVGATYNLQEIKQSTAEQLKSGLSVRNVWVVHAVARDYDDVDLLDVTKNFIRDHMNETYGSDEWKKSKKRDEETAMKMLRLLANP